MQFRCRVLSLILLLTIAGTSACAAAGPPSDVIVEHMAVKLMRGIVNVATCIVELPKQTYLTVSEDGAAGAVIGPLKGIGMTVYRALMGAGETAFFLIPQPGYYDPMIDPDYVWKGWDVPLSRDRN